MTEQTNPDPTWILLNSVDVIDPLLGETVEFHAPESVFHGKTVKLSRRERYFLIVECNGQESCVSFLSREKVMVREIPKASPLTYRSVLAQILDTNTTDERQIMVRYAIQRFDLPTDLVLEIYERVNRETIREAQNGAVGCWEAFQKDLLDRFVVELNQAWDDLNIPLSVRDLSLNQLQDLIPGLNSNLDHGQNCLKIWGPSGQAVIQRPKNLTTWTFRMIVPETGPHIRIHDTFHFQRLCAELL